MGGYVARNVIKLMLKSGIDVLAPDRRMGVTFKENCADIRNSKVIDIIRELRDHGVEVIVDDP